jgi:hypothetical protein
MGALGGGGGRLSHDVFTSHASLDKVAADAVCGLGEDGQ